LLPSRGLLERGVPILAQHWSKESWNRYYSEEVWNAMCQHSDYGINGEFAGNYHTMNEESTGGRGFRRELPAHRLEIHQRKGIPPGITSLFTRIEAGKIKICRKSFKRYQFQDQQFQILYTDNANFRNNLNTKMSIKLKINLIRPY
jgi:hypothetical protein